MNKFKFGNKNYKSIFKGFNGSIFLSTRGYKNIPLPSTPSKIIEKYNEPKVMTAIPGPKSQKMMKEDYAKSQKLYTVTTHFMVDMQKSHGNYLVDIDGNKKKI
jgi:N-acetylmuramic acid 6-phosphate (MurNAc-6-P) etherase